MQKGLSLTIAGVAALSLVAGTGCVTKKAWRENVEATDTRVKGVESGIETQEKRTSDLARDTDTRISQVKGTAEKAVEIGGQALTKAESAEKLAKGKILWTTTLSDDSVKFSFDGDKVPEGAQAILDELDVKSRHSYVPPLDRAAVCALLGNHSAAVDALVAGYDQRNAFLWGRIQWAEFDLIREDARYRDIMGRLNRRSV